MIELGKPDLARASANRKRVRVSVLTSAGVRVHLGCRFVELANQLLKDLTETFTLSSHAQSI
jgi:hypothetical protein